VGSVSQPDTEEPGEYPAHWEADVVLRDGSACHLRPITPQDEGRLRAFHAKLSAETIYYRYFAPYPELMQKDVTRFTNVDHVDRVAIVATVAGEIVGVGRYDRVADVDAEVAFTVRDDYQGRGLGSVLLEHLAAAARERGIRRFVAEVLPQNRRMVGTFTHAGYRVAQELDEGVVKLAFEIEPTEELRSVMQAREQRAEFRSVERVLNPASIAVIGVSRRQESLGSEVLRNLIEGGFNGRLYPIHQEASMVSGLPAFRRVVEAPGPVDLAIVVVPVDRVPGVVEDCAAAGVHALIVISSGFADIGPDGIERERELIASVRGHGMRMVGPNALGVINTDPRSRLRAAVPRLVPPRGRVALYGQSAPLSAAALDRMALRRLGISTFVSVGNRADVASHELLQYWQEDGLTSVVLLYVESLANPSKFMRVVRSLTRHKPVVVVRSGRTSQAFPLGARPRRTELPARAVDQLIRNAGVIETDSLGQLVDVGGLLACQPLPTGRRVTVIGDSHELVMLTADTCTSSGLDVADSVFLRGNSVAAALAVELERATHGSVTDAILVVHVPPVRPDDSEVRSVLVEAAAKATVPVLAVLHTEDGSNSLIPAPGDTESAGHGSVPFFGTVEEAVQSLRLVVQYASWRARDPGEIPDHPDIDSESARALVEDALFTHDGQIRTATVPLVGSQLTKLLSCYGIDLWTSLPVASEDEAVAEADELGWPVALKTTDPRLTRRGDYFGVRLNLENEQALRAAYLSLAANLDADAMSQLVVQRMALRGVHCVLRTQEDTLFGPVVTFGLGGSIPELLGDRAYQVPPMSDADAARLIRDTAASSVLMGYGGRERADIAGLEELVTRVGRMAEEVPQLARLDLNPLLVSPTGLAVLGASAWLRSAEARGDADARRLTDL
jgi:acyl-CoA synthetase (NDP forming)/GNAT superfamily N-acetyltransferase